MKSLFKKVRGNKKGFTLAELLVVVAIVGILVAISIPVFTSQLAKARKATNQANMRAAKAAAVAQYLTDNKDGKEAVYYDYDLEKELQQKELRIPLSLLQLLKMQHPINAIQIFRFLLRQLRFQLMVIPVILQLKVKAML